MQTRHFGTIAFAALALALGGQAFASHQQDWPIYGNNHDTPFVGFHEPSDGCLTHCAPLIDTAEKRAAMLTDAAKKEEFLACTGGAIPGGGQWAETLKPACQPLRARPPSPEPQDCPADKEITSQTQFENLCEPFAQVAEDFGQASCCLQWDIGQQGMRGYQLVMGPYPMDTSRNDAFTRAAVAVPNVEELTGEGETYEYMVGFEFWQFRGSHHFILNDLLGEFNNPDQPRGDCSQYEGTSQYEGCQNFDSMPERCDADSEELEAGDGCSRGDGGEMRAVPLAGSPGPSYFPVPYPEGVGIKLSEEHVFYLDHHVQTWYEPQIAQSWMNIYTKPAKRTDENGNEVENVEKEAHVFFDGSASGFYIPPHTISKAQGLWVAPRNIELYGLTAHSHKRNTLFTADMIGPDGQTLKPVRDYSLSSPVCGGYAPDGTPPNHLYESTDWADHEQCPFWLEDDGDNDREGALFIRQGEGIRYECVFNNGILPEQMMKGQAAPETGDPATDTAIEGVKLGTENAISTFPARTLAYQEVSVEPRDAFGNVVRGKFSCEEKASFLPMEDAPPMKNVPPNAPFISNRPCLPDILKGQPPYEDYDSQEEIEAVLYGGPAEECQGGTVNKGGYYQAELTGNCVPASLAFAETEDDEMCILLGLYAFADTDDDGGIPDDTNDDLVPTGTNGPLGENGIDRLPTDVGR